MIRTAILLVLLVASRGEAARNCLVGFAAVSDDADPEALVSLYHRQLWDELGGNRISPATTKQILESQDPFAIPEQPGADVSSLRSKMREFEKLVAQREWNTPEVRARLLSDLEGRLQESVDATESLRRAELNLAPSLEVRFPAESVYYIFHPHEDSILVMMNRGSSMVAYRTRTGRKEPLPGAPKDHGRFSSDGKEVFFGVENFQVNRVPYRDGVLDWAAATKIGAEKNSNGWIFKHFHQSPDGKKLYAGLNGNRPHSVFDLETGTRTEILGSPFGAGAGNQWKMVPGKDQFYLVESQNDRSWIRTQSVDSAGKAEEGTRTQLMTPHRAHILWESDAIFLAHTDHELYVANSPVHVPTKVIDKSGDRVTHKIHAVAADPKTNSAAVLMIPETNHEDPRLEWVDLNTKKVTGYIPLPRGVAYHALKFLPDGRIFVDCGNRALIYIPSEKLLPVP